ncbi:hypothetical protein BKA64DRAFT_685574 [Cadophora sp. MPI-SDFR-AT-0126]|nr:hypothetical protein BKA64DRAFT_685574 [Leotiomycetes sp. MPI-SDFR-AT-0126]
MSDRYERIGGSSVASNHYYEFRAVEFLFVLYTFGIFYILCSGLINFQKPSDDSVTLYGIDGVSGFYGPGSWAAWLLTTLACCIERLFHRRQAINRPQKSTLSFKSGIDLNLVAVYSYPIIAGVDLLRRCRRYDFSSPAASSEIGCIAASLTVLRMGTGLGTLLSGLSIRKRVIHQTSLLPAVFTIGASSVLFVMSVTFEFILIGTRFQDFALNLFGLPGRKIQSNPPDAGLGVLLENSALVDEVVRLPLLALYFGGGDFAIVPRMILPICLFYSFVAGLLMYGPSGRLFPQILGIVLVGYLGIIVLLMMATFLAVFFSVHFWQVTDVPITTASIGDLDQLSVLCLSGVLIVVNSLIEMLPGYGKLKKWALFWRRFWRRWVRLGSRDGKERGDEIMME